MCAGKADPKQFRHIRSAYFHACLALARPVRIPQQLEVWERVNKHRKIVVIEQTLCWFCALSHHRDRSIIIASNLLCFEEATSERLLMRVMIVVTATVQRFTGQPLIVIHGASRWILSCRFCITNAEKCTQRLHKITELHHAIIATYVSNNRSD